MDSWRRPEFGRLCDGATATGTGPELADLRELLAETAPELADRRECSPETAPEALR